MKDLLSNAIASIEVGVLDSGEAVADPRRGLSATRNLYAGVLLLLKERLSRIDSNLIKARVLPKLDDDQVVWVGNGKNTADYQDLRSRWESIGLPAFDWNRLNSLRRIRNNVEHLFHAGTEGALRQAVFDTFILITILLRDHLGEIPAQVFSEDVWRSLQEEAGTQHELAAACRWSRAGISGIPDPVKGIWAHLRCEDCDSELVRVTTGDSYPDVELVCDSCGEEPSARSLVLEALQDEYVGTRYEAGRDGDDDPMGLCPMCLEDAYLLAEDQCMLCLETRMYRECIRCTESVGLDEQDEGGLCGYCSHMQDKMDRD